MNLKRHAMRMLKRPEGRAPRSRAFTLIELILVMAILCALLAVMAPTLGAFFRGRTLDAEAKRFLALTRYGQSRAVSEGVPIVLWINAEESSYGLEIQTGYTQSDDQAKDFTLETGLQIEASLPPISAATTTASMSSQQTASLLLGQNNQPMIRFTPDGFIAETSPETISIRSTDGAVMTIAQSRSRLNYEIQTDNASR